MKGEKKLVIVPKQFKSDTTTIVSARISTELNGKISDLAKKTNRNRNEIIQILLSYAVEHVEINTSEEEN